MYKVMLASHDLALTVNDNFPTHFDSTFFKLLKWKNINKGWYNFPKVILSTIVYIDLIILVSFALDMGESMLT